MSSCHHHGVNDGCTTSKGEILDKTHNNQKLNPNVVTVTHNIIPGHGKIPRHAPIGLGLDT
jgi:hypothetical protein